MRTMVVDDEAVAAPMPAGMLAGEGGEAKGCAAMAAEALAVCEAMFPDLALLDVNLRTGGNGADVARALRGRWGLL